MLTRLFLISFILYCTLGNVKSTEGGEDNLKWPKNRCRRTCHHEKSIKEDLLPETWQSRRRRTKIHHGNHGVTGNSSSNPATDLHKMMDLSNVLGNMNYEQIFDSSRGHMDEGPSSSHQRSPLHYQQNEHDDPDEMDAQYLLDFALQDEINANESGNDNSQAETNRVIDLKDHSFLPAETRKLCRECSNYNRTRKNVQTRCKQCERQMCAMCFRDKHGLLDCPEIKKTTQPATHQICYYCGTNMGLGYEEDAISYHTRTCPKIPREGYTHACYMKDCDFKGLTGNDIKQHIRVHTGFCPYQCPICKAIFKQRSGLSKHRRIMRHFPAP